MQLKIGYLFQCPPSKLVFRATSCARVVAVERISSSNIADLMNVCFIISLLLCLVSFILNLAFVCSWYLFSAANIWGFSIVSKKISQKGSIYLCKRLHVHAICLRTHIIKHMIISVICTNMRKGNKFFRKPTRPSLPIRKAPPLISVFSPQGRRGKPLLLVARNRYALRLADHQRSRQIVRDGTAWG